MADTTDFGFYGQDYAWLVTVRDAAKAALFAAVSSGATDVRISDGAFERRNIRLPTTTAQMGQMLKQAQAELDRQDGTAEPACTFVDFSMFRRRGM